MRIVVRVGEQREDRRRFLIPFQPFNGDNRFGNVRQRRRQRPLYRRRRYPPAFGLFGEEVFVLRSCSMRASRSESDPHANRPRRAPRRRTPQLRIRPDAECRSKPSDAKPAKTTLNDPVCFRFNLLLGIHQRPVPDARHVTLGNRAGQAAITFVTSSTPASSASSEVA